MSGVFGAGESMSVALQLYLWRSLHWFGLVDDVGADASMLVQAMWRETATTVGAGHVVVYCGWGSVCVGGTYSL